MTDTLLHLEHWVGVCDVADLAIDRGACVLVGGRQVALFRLAPGDRVHAISNFDPFSSAFVLSRGIVGSRGDVAKVASPMYKQSFDLETGRCLDEPTVAVEVFEVRCDEGRVLVRCP
ncbi:MAG TPA: nitrite reductase small subunit NirD [Acidimicrobiales bacterium]|nr:nitrite reductase small subunit NirD [Acidimicrobiales bacterium]